MAKRAKKKRKTKQEIEAENRQKQELTEVLLDGWRKHRIVMGGPFRNRIETGYYSLRTLKGLTMLYNAFEEDFTDGAYCMVYRFNERGVRMYAFIFDKLTAVEGQGRLNWMDGMESCGALRYVGDGKVDFVCLNYTIHRIWGGRL